jgi:hypothetical protein
MEQSQSWDAQAQPMQLTNQHTARWDALVEQKGARDGGDRETGEDQDSAVEERDEARRRSASCRESCFFFSPSSHSMLPLLPWESKTSTS